MNFVDPVEAPGTIAGSRRGNGFGPDITAAFLQKNNLSWLLRSHEWCRWGHKPTHNNICFTVFSAANYRNRHRNFGAVAHLTLVPSGADAETPNRAVPQPDGGVDTGVELPKQTATPEGPELNEQEQRNVMQSEDVADAVRSHDAVGSVGGDGSAEEHVTVAALEEEQIVVELAQIEATSTVVPEEVRPEMQDGPGSTQEAQPGALLLSSAAQEPQSASHLRDTNCDAKRAALVMKFVHFCAAHYVSPIGRADK
jgi:hypothetical protein